MALIFDALCAWLAPVLCFTAEEAWQAKPHGVFEDLPSVHLRTFPAIPESFSNAALAEKWNRLLAIRRVVLGALEPHRLNKTIGSSLEAHPIVHLDTAMQSAVQGLDLAELCITSQITLAEGMAPEGAFTLSDVPGVAVMFQQAQGAKCLRCWKILPEVGRDTEYPDLSLRDADAVRWYVQHQQKAA